MTPDLDTLWHMADLQQWAGSTTDEPWGYWPDADPDSAYAQYVTTMSPATILSMIATTRRLEAALLDLVVGIDPAGIDGACGWCGALLDVNDHAAGCGYVTARAALAGQPGGGE